MKTGLWTVLLVWLTLLIFQQFHYPQIRYNPITSCLLRPFDNQNNQNYVARQFDKGIFNGREINVYEFENQDDLRLVLAHELGHALGLKHTQDNPQALMYPILKQQNLENFQLTGDDIALLNNNFSWNSFLNKLKR